MQRSGSGVKEMGGRVEGTQAEQQEEEMTSVAEDGARRVSDTCSKQTLPLEEGAEVGKGHMPSLRTHKVACTGTGLST